MVQLKVFSLFVYDNYSGISIPYGSIKSVSTAAGLASPISFQFLMVQLKACPSNWNSYCSNIFQFLMVQLKVPKLRMIKVFWSISIPYGSIKSSGMAVSLVM